MTPMDAPDLSDPTDLLDRSTGLAAWRQIADALEGDIASGALPPGAQVPTELRLAARFGVNRHTVRRALGHLVERGLVRTTQGRGTFVEIRPLAYPIGLRTRFSEEMARAGREAGGDVLSAGAAVADSMTAEALGIEPGAPVLQIVTLHKADGVPLSLARLRFPLPRFEGLDKLYARHKTLTRAYAAMGLGDYTRLSTRITAANAQGEEARLLDLAPGRLLLVVNSVNVDTEGRRIQATQSRFVADRVELTVTPQG